MITDLKRLQQVLKNLLSNAFKFTTLGGIAFRIKIAAEGWSSEHPILKKTSRVIAFEVSDTGIGIPVDKQRIIFEAFHQADAGTSRRYGGTGLGLAISRELATLLGGEIRLVSNVNEGSTFSLYLPESYFVSPSADISIKRPAFSPAPLVLQPLKIEEVADDREAVLAGDPTILIVEDDPHIGRTIHGEVVLEDRTLEVRVNSEARADRVRAAGGAVELVPEGQSVGDVRGVRRLRGDEGCGEAQEQRRDRPLVAVVARGHRAMRLPVALRVVAGDRARQRLSAASVARAQPSRRGAA